MSGRRKIPFLFARETEKFSGKFRELVSGVVAHKRSTLMQAENTLAYYHGHSWRQHASWQPDKVSTLKEFEHEILLKLDDVRNNNISRLRELIDNLTSEMQKAFFQMMYAELDSATKSTGNTVDAKAVGSKAEAFIQMLEKIDFGVDRKGQPTVPSIHAAPETVEALLIELKSQGPEFEQRVESIKVRKKAEALQREKERRGRFLSESSI
jgi:hypothetical protein